MRNYYSTRAEAIAAEIVEPIEATGTTKDVYAEVDVEAIAAAYIYGGITLGGWQYTTFRDTNLWALAQKHML